MEAYKTILTKDSTQFPTIQSKQVLSGVKAAARTFDLDAQVVLFGSRARGDARKDSDYDFLILLHKPVDFQLKRQVLDKLYEVELQTDCIIGALIENTDDWQLMEHSPIFSEIKNEGVLV
ncbi:MAG: nucleotidyltransferase domain-containing protein [Saprospiraceae bacterium]